MLPQPKGPDLRFRNHGIHILNRNLYEHHCRVFSLFLINVKICNEVLSTMLLYGHVRALP